MRTAGWCSPSASLSAASRPLSRSGAFCASSSASQLGPSPSTGHLSARYCSRAWRPDGSAEIQATVGGVSWVRSHYERNRAEYAPTAGLPAPQVDQRRIQRDARRLARANRKMTDAEALAAPEAGQVKPQTDQV